MLEASMRYMLICLAFVSTPALAETDTILGADGDYLGTIQSAGPHNFIYGRDGDYVGSTSPMGNSTVIYDNQGNWVGTVMHSGLRRN